jgi:hypothetical protein
MLHRVYNTQWLVSEIRIGPSSQGSMWFQLWGQVECKVSMWGKYKTKRCQEIRKISFWAQGVWQFSLWHGQSMSVYWRSGWSPVESHSKLLSGFSFIGPGNPDNNLESPGIYRFATMHNFYFSIGPNSSYTRHNIYSSFCSAIIFIRKRKSPYFKSLCGAS